MIGDDQALGSGPDGIEGIFRIENPLDDDWAIPDLADEIHIGPGDGPVEIAGNPAEEVGDFPATLYGTLNASEGMGLAPGKQIPGPGRVGRPPARPYWPGLTAPTNR